MDSNKSRKDIYESNQGALGMEYKERGSHLMWIMPISAHSLSASREICIKSLGLEGIIERSFNKESS